MASVSVETCRHHFNCIKNALSKAKIKVIHFFSEHDINVVIFKIFCVRKILSVNIQEVVNDIQDELPQS